MNKDKIWAVVLAGGESRRMGTPKMLLPFRGMTMIEKTIATIREAGVGNIMVVLGAETEKLPLLLQKLSVYYCINFNHHEGMLSSVVCGINNLPEAIEAVIVCPGDQPLINPSTISNMINLFASSDKGIFIPVYEGKRGHPLMFDAKYRNEINFLEPEKGLRSLISSHPEDVYEIVTSDPGILKDFDTYDDYLSELNQIS